MEERKFCMKSRAELDEIRKQQASKKASVNENIFKDIEDGKQLYRDSYAKAKELLPELKTKSKEELVAMLPHPFGQEDIDYYMTKDVEYLIKKILTHKFSEEIANVVIKQASVNEISDELAQKVANRRQSDYNKAKELLNKAVDKSVEKHKGFLNIPQEEYDKDIHPKYKDLENKANKLKRNSRKVQAESLTASKALAMSKSILEGEEELLYSPVGKMEIGLPLEAAKELSMPGDAQSTVDYWKQQPRVKNQLDKLTDEQIDSIKEYLDMDDEEFANLSKEDKLDYIIWITGGYIYDEWYENQNEIGESKINEDWKEYDYQYLTVKEAIEDIEDDYEREIVLQAFNGLIKRLEYSVSKLPESKINESKDYQFDNIVISIYGEPTEDSKVVEEKMSGFGMQNLEIINVYNSEDEAVQDHLARIKAGEQPNPLVYETQETIDFINKHHHLPSLDADDFDAEYSAWAD